MVQKDWCLILSSVVKQMRLFAFILLHFATLSLVSPWNDVSETSTENPYWWRITTQIWVLMCHNYGIFVLFSQTSFRGVTSGGVTKCWLFSQTKYLLVYKCNARESSEIVHICILWHLHLNSFLYCWCVPVFNVSCVGKQISLQS